MNKRREEDQSNETEGDRCGVEIASQGNISIYNGIISIIKYVQVTRNNRILVKRGTVLLNADVQVKWKKIKGDLTLIEYLESIM